jgi:hypothetical protein
MELGSIKKPLGANRSANQNISLAQVIENIVKNEESFDKMSEIEKQDLINQLTDQIERNSDYNQVSDRMVYFGSDSLYSEEQTIALRKSNRERVEILINEMDTLIERAEKEIDKTNYFVEYDKENVHQAAMMDYLFPEHEPGQATYRHIQEIRRILGEINQIETDTQLNKVYKKVAKYRTSSPEKKGTTPGTEQVNMQEKYDPAITNTLAYNSHKKKYKVSPFEKEAEDFIAYLYESRDYKHVRRYEFFKDLDSLNMTLTENEKDLGEDNIGPKVALIPIVTEVKTGRAAAGYLKSTLGSIDGQNSFIDNIYKGKEPYTVGKGKNNNKDYYLADIWDSCLDCFAKDFMDSGKFKKDFNLGLDFEYEAKELIDSLTYLIEKVKFAIDTEYIFKQNLCSLARLGNLCPIEKAYIIACCISLLFFTWKEVFENNFGLDFLGQILIGGILQPALKLVDLSFRFSISPIPGYQICALESIERLQDTGAALSGPASQFGLTLKKLSTPDATNNVDPRTKENMREETSTTTEESSSNTLDPAVRERIKKIYSTGKIDPSDITKIVGNDTFSVIASPLFSGNVLDSLEAVKAMATESSEKMQGISKWIKKALKDLNDFISKNSVAKVELATKIMAISSVYTLLSNLDKVFDNNKQVCIPIPVPAVDGNGETFIFESPFTSTELVEMTELEEVKYENIVTRTRPNGVAELGRQAYIENPITDRRFNLVNCDRAKSSIISKGESLEFWKQIALGAKINNV